MTPSLTRSAGRFLVVGVANTLVGLGTILVLKAALGFGDVAANAIGYGVGIALGFVLNRRWTFESAGPWRIEALRYAAVLLTGYGLNLSTVLWLIRGGGIDPYLAQVAGVVPYTLFVFLTSRSLVFRGIEGGRSRGKGS
jgi:putative flippase GtrA